MKTNNNKKGITLIALVITIIIMLILVGVTITLVMQGKLFEYAGKAAQETETKKIEEEDYLNVTPGMNTNELIANYTDQDEYSDDKWEYAWTYPSLKGKWSNTYTQSNKPDSFEGSIVAKLFEKEDGYDLIIEGNGPMGDLSVRACNTLLAKADKVLIDSSNKSFLIAWAEISYAWDQYFDVSLIKRVYIRDGVTSIGRRAFQGCTNLTTIEIPSTVTNIREYAFTNCNSLETIRFNGTKSEWTDITKSGTFEIDIECSDGMCSYEGEKLPVIDDTRR